MVNRPERRPDVQARPLATALANVPATLIDGLRAAVSGAVIVPGDDEYESARQVHSAHVSRFPAAVVRASCAADVAAVIRVARAAGVELAVRSGGHSGPGFGTSDGGVVLDLAGLRGIAIDVDAATVWAGSGLTA